MQVHVRAPVSKPPCLSSYRAGFVNPYSSVRVRPGAPAFANCVSDWRRLPTIASAKVGLFAGLHGYGWRAGSMVIMM